MNNLSSQWRPLTPWHDLCSGGSGGYYNYPRANQQQLQQQQQQRRSVVTKNFQNAFQVFPSSSQNNYGLNKMNFENGNASRDRGSPINFPFASRPGNLTSPSTTNRVVTRQQPFSQQGALFGMNDTVAPSPSSNTQFDFTINNQRNSTSFNRSVSLQDHSHTMVNGFGRQLSTSGNSFDFRPPTPFNGTGGANAGGALSTSPPPTLALKKFPQRGSPMKIGTWNSVSSSPNNGSFPQISTFEIGTFNSNNVNGDVNNPTMSSSSGNRSSVNGETNQNSSGPGVRETGIIEKLLHSYGFIQCCDRQARLFFHFSQFDGNIEHLKVGDPVEFEMTYDRRTGKPIASLVSKISPEVVMSEERVIGTVTTEARVDPDTGNPTQGRISYENRGECFFLPFTMSDVEGNVTVASGDKVSFQMATMQRSGNLVARTIRLENPAAPVKYQGVVNSIKESFGFIERADVVKEIFFHFSESGNEDISLGDDVEFTIQSRNSKEVACNITKLKPGTVVFVDVGTEYIKGQVLKPLDRNLSGEASPTDADPLPGRVKYRGQDRSEIEIPFGEKDQLGDFTLRHGDWVKFLVAVDRRDKLRRATKIELLNESFEVSDERREQGIIESLKDGFGFLTCVDRDAKIFFQFSECLDVSKELSVGDECEFTVTPDSVTRYAATRIKHLKKGSVTFNIIVHKNVVGEIQATPVLFQDESDAKDGAGKIVYELNGTSLEIPLWTKDYNFRKLQLSKGDFVVFDINQLKSTKETNAVNVRLIRDTNEKETTATSVLANFESDSFGKVKQGYIAALKDGFGFVETLERDKEIFFHFSNVDGKSEKLEVGTEVEYRLCGNSKDKKISAEKVRILPRGTIPSIPSSDEILDGKVVRTLRSVNPDQECYMGLVQVRSEEGQVLGEYAYGIASLKNKKELLQIHDPVQFQVSECGKLAVNIRATKEKLRATVEAVKGQFGFLSHEVEEGKKLFFHMSEVEAGFFLQQGDEVEFVVVTNKRTGKHSACCVKKIVISKRPERLVSRLKALNMEDSAKGGPKIVVIRQPRGPDGTKGFKSRSTVAAIALLEKMESKNDV